MAGAASEQQQLISKEWTVEVKNFLKIESGATVVRASMRVPKALINVKAEAYIPQMVSLGPYHHRSLQEEAMGPYHQRLNHLSQMDFYKLQSTRDAAQNKPIQGFFTQVEGMMQKFGEFYDWKIDDEEKFGWMMLVDTLFLYQFLKNGLHLFQREIDNPDEDKPTKSTCCERVVTAKDDMVAFVFALCFPHPAKQGRDDFLERYNAKELVKAGIKFKSGSDKIRFDKHSDTLFIPKIVISDTYTEVMMRNLLALEFNDANRPKHVTQYVELMDCLIDTPEDVTLLRKCHVIDRHSMMITDEYVANMWDGMAKPLFFSGFLEHAQGLKAGVRETLIKNYYKSKITSWWAEFHGEHLSRPWKALALLTAILVVGLTAIQTYCSLADCQKKS